MKTKISKVLFVVIITVVAFSADAATCNFVRDLGMSTRGEDVRCLQQYLNSSGYSANFYGYNFSDGFFGPLTRQAVMNWQASNSVPVSGYFDAMSRTKYFELSGIYGRVLGVSIDNQEQRAIERIGDALNMIKDAEDEIDDSNRNTRSAKKLLEDAKEDMLDSIRTYFIYIIPVIISFVNLVFCVIDSVSSVIYRLFGVISVVTVTATSCVFKPLFIIL